MASSNRHWPSMFKSKPACNPHHQWQHDINSSLISSSCHRTPYSSEGCEERSPEPKPRWNPKPEQIRILEAIFNSGMVNPPRDEIRKIRAQLQEYGQVGDANVFYWFQNRKSRSKHKLRHLQNQNSSKNQQNILNQEPPTQQQNPNPISSSLPQITPPSSSSSSSEKSPPKEIIPSKVFSLGFSNINDVVPNSPTTSVNQTYLHSQNETTLLPPPPQQQQVASATNETNFFFPMQQHGQGIVLPNNVVTSQGFCFSELSNMVHAQPHNTGHCTSFLLSEIMNHGANSSKKDQDQDNKSVKIMHQIPHFNFCFTPTTSTTTVVPPTTSSTITVPSPIISHAQGHGETGVTAARSMVFINDVAFEVASGPFNVREAFGDEAVLIHATGQPVLTNQWGVTLQSLHHGACYYLI
ncbi:WUSCHEL-related homeobox 9-like isoform X1 [Cicer arietinum]|uniref:WUSCHEL-related homeobox 9-like isoform X1 n=1 Tax=Cicer arietinum TaxID=3827 RepID=A0A1S2X9U6_CICAR|nr:WUSCHEL-related homeobox 9-like isoform X1 [Cicer arietinum]